jgi:DNA-binding transcriptional MerR regulator
MAVDEKEETQKLYYSITEVSDMFDLNASTIRFWEKEFEILKPSKNKKGNRVFTKKDIDYISLIVDLVKQKGYTISGAKEQLKHRVEDKTKDQHQSEVVAKLNLIKEKLIQLRDSHEQTKKPS